MSWHHRVVRYADGTHKIVEAYIEDGRYVGFSDPFIESEGDTPISDLRETLERMMRATYQPVLTPQEISGWDGK